MEPLVIIFRCVYCSIDDTNQYRKAKVGFDEVKFEDRAADALTFRIYYIFFIVVSVS